jgi:hypothetical protein
MGTASGSVAETVTAPAPASVNRFGDQIRYREYTIPCYDQKEAIALVATEIGGGTLCEIRQLPHSKELRVRINLR